uniref:LITAF domain-containing protein n=1 Tax=Chrysotila carterae TaxID=13221 RepID=A0A7S4FCS4_CHRCT|mmetsp:Transcript_35418/g.74355  ORF Transcript_35418/g.74355 Transcript_35418/m.74355 type:complete len:133 (+) Transcript_35418:957-1355(+)
MPKQALAVAHGVPVDEQYVPMGCAVSVTPAAASQPASQPTHVHVVVEQRGRQAASDAFFAAQTRVEASPRPVVVTCPHCHQTAETRTRTHVGEAACLWCCCTCCWSCVACRDTVHRCAHCNHTLGAHRPRTC